MIDAKAREALRGLQRFAGTLLGIRLGLTPNQITTSGVLLTGVAAWRLVDGAFVQAGLILILAGITDFCDGAVAKMTGRATTFGAFFDSVSDRFSDAIILGSVVWFFIRQGDETAAVAALLALCGALLTSYIRGKAESLGFDCKVGVMERAERVILLIAGLLFGFVEVVVWVLVAGAGVTIVQRLVHVSKQARGT